jgi:uncharacterized protein YndB with AHSA1/START domain
MTRKPTTHFAVRLSCIVTVPPERAYDAFTRADEMSSWFSTKASIDPRVGGRYSNSDNDRGRYLIVDRPLRLRFTWENAKHCPGTEVEVNFVRSGETTRVELIHSRIPDLAGHDDMRQGWTWALASLKSYLETGKSIPYEIWRAGRARAKGKGA